jgi:uncharacterized protein
LTVPGNQTATKRSYFFYLGHPAHFHLFRHVITGLRDQDHHVVVGIKKKDVLEHLVRESGFIYVNLQPEGRKDSRWNIALGLAVRDWRLFRMAAETRPTLMVGTSPEITHVGKILRIPSVVVNEDDAEAVPLFAKFAYPLASVILSPESCSAGKWSGKKAAYDGYHELAYLHPRYFTPRIEKLHGLKAAKRPFFLLRFSALGAHHDRGKKGIDRELALRITRRLVSLGKVYITSERPLEPELQQFRIPIKPTDIHHALAFAEIVIGDSQTMTAEAAVLGTPSLRFNDFVGRLGYLEELEHRYGLTFGIPTTQPERLMAKLDELLAFTELRKEWRSRRNRMLAEKIDVTEFFIWFLENYPESMHILRDDPDYQRRFKVRQST